MLWFVLYDFRWPPMWLGKKLQLLTLIPTLARTLHWEAIQGPRNIKPILECLAYSGFNIGTYKPYVRLMGKMLYIWNSINWLSEKTKTAAVDFLTGEVESESLIQAYYGVFHCHLNYGLIVWGSPSHTD